MNRLAVLSFVLAALLASSTTIAPGASSRLAAPITKAQAVALARAVNLTASDLPGARNTEQIPPNERGAGTLSHELRCARPGVAIYRPVDEDVWLLHYRRSFVASDVRVMPTATIAPAQLAAFATRRGHACFARGVAPAENGPFGKPIKSTFIPLVKLLGAGAIGVRTLSKADNAPRSAVFHTDGVLFRVGRVEILVISFGARTFPPATEGRLLARLRSRAEDQVFPGRPRPAT